MNSNIPTISHRSYDVKKNPHCHNATNPINTTPIAPCVINAGKLMNNNNDFIAVADFA
jgi:hypothetical protein